MSKLKFANAILCDHATPGANNKHTLVNVYSGDILFSGLPATAMLGLYLEHVPDKDGSLSMSLEFRVNNTGVAGMSIEANGLVRGEIGVILIPGVPLSFSEEGTLTVVATSPGYKPTTVISKKIKAGLISPSA